MTSDRAAGIEGKLDKELREILGDEDWKYTEKPHKLLALLEREKISARYEERLTVAYSYKRHTPDEFVEINKKRIAELKLKLEALGEK